MSSSPVVTPRPSISEAPATNELVTPHVPSIQMDARQRKPSGDVAVASPALGLPTALKPIGIVNEQNTCFLNSTFQALSATTPLISLLNSSPHGQLVPSPTSLLPPPALPFNRIPSLLPEALEPPLYPLLPVTKTFVACLQKSWKMKDGGGGTYGSGETSSGRSMRLHHLLREMAKKYDQYDEYMQQDAHELLRHLLDSMEMEEKDIIKRVQPQPPLGKNKRRRKLPKDGISPMASPLPSPAPSAPSSPTRKATILPTPRDLDGHLGLGEPHSQAVEIKEIPENEMLIPFVDVLFGGLLASVVVCENCKSVSHTYEGFLDISLSLKGDAPKPRKRDKLKAAFGLKSKSSSLRKTSGSDAHLSSHDTISESELSDSERRTSVSESDRRKSMDQDDRPIVHDSSSNGVRRNSSVIASLKGGFGFNKGRRDSKDKDKKASRPSSSSSSSIVDPDKTPPATSIPGSPNTSAHHRSLLGLHGSSHGPGPTPAQAAYISRILAGPNGGQHHHDDPLARLHAANSGDGAALHSLDIPADSGLEESLRNFTSVEVLEGENAFACRKCWKVKSGKYQNHHKTLYEEPELETSPHLRSSKAPPPSISIVSGSESDLSRSQSSLPVGEERRLGRASSTTSRSSAAQSQRAPSPLRRVLESGDNDDVAVPGDSPNIAPSAASVFSSESGGLADQESLATVDVPTLDIPDHAGTLEGEDDGESDGLSESSSEDEPPPQMDLPVGSMRPKPTRRKSSHFVMRRAFKRYLIAKAPEVLVFHFKRFKQTHKSGLTFTSFYDLKKMDDYVSFPEMLDLAPYMAPDRHDYKLVPTPSGPRAPYMDWQSVEKGPEREPVMYRLYALVVHLGSMVGGHYIAYVLVDPGKMFGDPSAIQVESEQVTENMSNLALDQSAGGGYKSMPASASNSAQTSPNTSRTSVPKAGQPAGKKDKRVWCYCSDTSIRLASIEEVLKAKAYICFYEKVKV